MLTGTIFLLLRGTTICSPLKHRQTPTSICKPSVLYPFQIMARSLPMSPSSISSLCRSSLYRSSLCRNATPLLFSHFMRR
mmetsp:Transcript_2705/g.6534  ORF Transcript_2705/g.6534 Transcript_2705/m.6534 type:complete len:80 (-) Transcript_2705:636-875(-)